MRTRALALALVAGAALALLPAGAANAHPLGNFTTNTADRIEIVSGGVRVLHVLDLAEVPTLQLAQASRGVNTNGDRVLDDAELTAYAQRLCPEIEPQLRLGIDGSPTQLRVDTAVGHSRPGAGGLLTARLECTLTSPDRPRESLSFTDEVSGPRNGWSEVTVVSGCGLLEGSTVPVDSASALLTAYPQDLLSSPLDVHAASTGVRSGGPCASSVDGVDRNVDAAQPRGADRVTSRFTDFVARQHLTLGFVLGAILISILFGAFHALAPGHGKTVVAAYLVGQRGTKRQAVWLGAAVTIAHTASVLVLGAVLSLTTLAGDGSVVPWTEVASGVLLVLVGAYLMVIARQRWVYVTDHTHEGPAHEHPHPHDHTHPHDHSHDHSHDHDHDHPHPHTRDHPHPHEHEPADHAVALAVADPETAPSAPARTEPLVHTHGGRAHSHAPLDDRPLGWRSLVTMGLAGGLVPSPSALVVLLGSTALGHTWFGVSLVLCYGIGMAMTLTAAGLLLLRAQGFLAARGWAFGQDSKLLRVLPVVTAAAVIVIGAALVARGYRTVSRL